MNLIEQAAARLQQLRDAGVEIPELADRPAKAVEPARPDTVVSAVDTFGPVAEKLAMRDATSRQSPAAPSSPVIGESRAPRIELDLDAIRAKGLVTPGSGRTELADQFRVIKRPVIANAAGKGVAPLNHGNLVMVTSALPGEGKSFTAINLAMSIADELDHTVMLVDADVARPSIPGMLDFKPGKGLLDVLQGEVQIQDVLLRTNVPKLTLLPSGTGHAKATELLASQSMKQLLDDIALRYHDRIVIFDSPPLLLTTEARVLATHMGQIIVVVQAGKTLQADVESAVSTIESCPVKMLLLNQARPDAVGRGGYGYGYGYGYGKRYGYGYGAERAAADAGGAGPSGAA